MHVLFNVLGAGVWVFYLSQLAELMRRISPSVEGLEVAERLAADSPRQIANAYTLFEVINAFVCIWFTEALAALVVRLLPALTRRATRVLVIREERRTTGSFRSRDDELTRTAT